MSRRHGRAGRGGLGRGGGRRAAVDRVDRLGPGIEIARGARRIAVESVVAGIGLSVLGMIAAACGYLTPVEGALIQEAIDVAVILNALRTLRITPKEA